MTYYVVIMVMLCMASSVSAAKCYVCANAGSDEDCNSKGMACYAKENELCLSAVRRENGLYKIYKSCKSVSACQALQLQNQHLCNTNRSVALCFQCCEGNYCNKIADWPRLEPKKPKPIVDVMSWPKSASLVTKQQASYQPKKQRSTLKKYKKKYAQRLKKSAMYKRSVMNPWKLKSNNLRKRPIYVGQITTTSNGIYFDNNQNINDSSVQLMMNNAPPVATCGIPRLSGISLNKLGVWPTGASFLIKLNETTTSTQGWTVLVIFPSPLPAACTITVWTAQLKQDPANREAFLFENLSYNPDISTFTEYNVTFVVDFCPSGFSATLNAGVAGFYDHTLSGGQCTTTLAVTSVPATTVPGQTTAATTPSAATTVAGQTSAAVTTVAPVTTAPAPPQSSCVASPSGFTLVGPAYPGFVNDIRVHAYIAVGGSLPATPQKKDWTIKLVFNVPVITILCWEVRVANTSADGRVLLLRPLSWYDVLNDRLFFDIIVSYNGNTVPVSAVYFCENSTNVDLTIPSNVQYPYGVQTSAIGTIQSTTGISVTTIGSAQSTTGISGAATTPSSITTPPTAPSSDRCNGSRGLLPPVSGQAVVNYTPCPTTDNLLYDYNEVLHKSILFYEAQRSGPMPPSNRILWRGDSNVHDGCDVGVDLTGGWHDGTDNVKYGFPMASTLTVLAWGMVDFANAYKDGGEWVNALDMLKWGTDYFLKAHTAPNELYGQVGDPLIDQTFWTRPEELTTPRTTYKINETLPGSDLAGETAAALAAASIVFKTEDPAYSATLLQHALQLYDFANKFRGAYDQSIVIAARFYPSLSGFGDELTWAALWLYRATLDAKYLDDATKKLYEFGLHKRPYDFSWDNKLAGIQVLLAALTNHTTFRGDVENFLNHCLTESSVPRTPGGLAFFSSFGTNSYAANAALIALAAASMIQPPLPNQNEYISFAETQIHALLGSGDGGRSYIVGFGNNPPDQPYHAASSCPQWTSPSPPKCNQTSFNSANPNPHILYGALVGGPDKAGSYKYGRREFTNNEVSINYNAGFQSAVAGLKHFVIKDRAP